MLKRLRDRFDDLMNPIVVKEIRQAVRGRYVAVLFMLFLAVQLLVLAGALLEDGRRGSSDFVAQPRGAEPFQFMYGILMVGSLFFVPLLGALRMNSERSEDNTDLYYISSLHSRSIVWGKLLATAVVALLLLSASVPSMMLTYFLRGVELNSVLLLLWLGMWLVLIAIQAALMVAALPVNRFLRGMAGLGLAGYIVGLISMVIYMAAEAMDRGFWRFIQTDLFQWGRGLDTWLVVLIATLVPALALLILYSFTLSLIKPPSSNRTFAARMSLASTWLATGVGAVWASEYYNEPAGVVLWGGLLALPLLGFMMLVSICERDRWGARMKRFIPRSRPLRVLLMPFFAGSITGLALSVGLIGVTMLVMGWYFMEVKVPDHIASHLVTATVASVLYAYAYMMTALLIQRYFLKRLIPAVQTWVVLLLLLGLVLTVQFTVAMVMEVQIDRPMEAWWLWLANPFQVHDKEFAVDALLFTAVWAMAVTALAVPWAIRCLKDFSPETALDGCLARKEEQPKDALTDEALETTGG